MFNLIETQHISHLRSVWWNGNILNKTSLLDFEQWRNVNQGYGIVADIASESRLNHISNKDNRSKSAESIHLRSQISNTEYLNSAIIKNHDVSMASLRDISVCTQRLKSGRSVICIARFHVTFHVFWKHHGLLVSYLWFDNFIKIDENWGHKMGEFKVCSTVWIFEKYQIVFP